MICQKRSVLGEIGRAFVHEGGGAVGKGAVDDVAVAR